MKDAFCPICRKKLPSREAQDGEFAPFCSEHCKMVDLGKWFTDGYAIPGDKLTDDRADEES